MLNIYKVSDKEYPDKHPFEHYSSFIVVADSEETAKQLHPTGKQFKLFDNPIDYYGWIRGWTDPKDTEVQHIGYTDKDYKNPTIISTSYHKL